MQQLKSQQLGWQNGQELEAEARASHPPKVEAWQEGRFFPQAQEGLPSLSGKNLPYSPSLPHFYSGEDKFLFLCKNLWEEHTPPHSLQINGSYYQTCLKASNLETKQTKQKKHRGLGKTFKGTRYSRGFLKPLLCLWPLDKTNVQTQFSLKVHGPGP